MRLTTDEARADGWGERAEAFTAWKNKVDDIVIAKTGMDCDCFPDWDFARAFQSRTSPAAAARKFLRATAREAGFNPKDLGF